MRIWPDAAKTEWSGTLRRTHVAAKLCLRSNKPCRDKKGGCAVETPTAPQCDDCHRPLWLVTAIDGFFDRPPVRIFKCEKCSRLVMFFLEDGHLRKT